VSSRPARQDPQELLEGGIEQVDVGLKHVGFNIDFTIGNGMLMSFGCRAMRHGCRLAGVARQPPAPLIGSLPAGGRPVVASSPAIDADVKRRMDPMMKADFELVNEWNNDLTGIKRS
jgi:hypothetical protein